MRCSRLLSLCVCLTGCCLSVKAQVNSWSNPNSGAFKWETPSNWSLGAAPNNVESVFITNSANATPDRVRVIGIDPTTVVSNISSLTVSNLTLSGPGTGFNSTFNTLVISNVNNVCCNQRVTIVNNLTISTHGTLVISNSAVFVGSPGGTLTVDGGGNLILNTGSLIMSNDNICTPACVTNDTTVIGDTGSGQMTVQDGTWRGSTVILGNAAGSQGRLLLAGGTNIVQGILGVTVGGGGIGQMTVSNGLFQGSVVKVAQGTLSIAGGASTTGVQCGFKGTGTVWLTSGQLAPSAFSTLIGGSGIGQMIVSNGTWQGSSNDWLSIGYNVAPGFSGFGSGVRTLTIAGGTSTLARVSLGGYGFDPADSNSVGTVWLTGGRFLCTNGSSYIGMSGVGQFTISNGTWLAGDVAVGTYLSRSRGTLTIAGGTVSAGAVTVENASNPSSRLNVLGGNTSLTNLTVGDCGYDYFGIVQVSAGILYVTNASHNAELRLNNGLMFVSGGTVVVDKLVATNSSCVSLVDQTGGTLSVGTLVLDPNGDIDGDGLPNWWEQLYSLDPLSSSGNNGPDGDPDGDGYSNMQEYLMGTNPLDPNSPPPAITFQIASIALQGSNVVLSWTGTGGSTNQVQTTGGDASGDYVTNGFVNLGAPLNLIGTGQVTTNYIDVGGATNQPARYYRIRVVP
jgi:hypothetical protein